MAEITARYRKAGEPLEKSGDFQYQDSGFTAIDNPMAEFSSSDEYACLAFACPQTGKPCANGSGIAIGYPQKPNFGPSWQWNGNVENPTLLPSINCTGGCGWHGYLTNGVFKSV